jgi:hypothetical protein
MEMVRMSGSFIFTIRIDNSDRLPKLSAPNTM